MKPTFVSQDAPVSCRVDERLQPWEEKPEGGGRNLRSQSSKFPLKQKEDEDDREKALTLSGKRKRGGERRPFLLTFGYGSESKHLFVSRIYILAAQSFPFKVQTTKDV